MRRDGPSRRTPAKRRILIVECHSLVRRGLTALIDNEPDLVVCGAAATLAEALEAIAPSLPDLVIAGHSPDGMAGLATVKGIRAGHEDLPILVLSMHDAPSYAARAFLAGASGFVTKREMGETLLIAIRSVLAGEKYESPDPCSRFGATRIVPTGR